MLGLNGRTFQRVDPLLRRMQRGVHYPSLPQKPSHNGRSDGSFLARQKLTHVREEDIDGISPTFLMRPAAIDVPNEPVLSPSIKERWA